MFLFDLQWLLFGFLLILTVWVMAVVWLARCFRHAAMRETLANAANCCRRMPTARTRLIPAIAPAASTAHCLPR